MPAKSLKGMAERDSQIQPFLAASELAAFIYYESVREKWTRAFSNMDSTLAAGDSYRVVNLIAKKTSEVR